MPFIHVSFPDGHTWLISHCEIVIPLRALLSQDLSAQEIGERVLALVPHIQALDVNAMEATTLPDSKRQQPSRPGFVYVVQWRDVYKIGKTQSPKGRIRAMKVQFPYPLTVRLLIPTEDIDGFESALHERFAAQRQGGEWFELTPEDIDALADEYPTVNPSQLIVG